MSFVRRRSLTTFAIKDLDKMSVKRSILYRTTQGSFTHRRPFSSFPRLENISLVRENYFPQVFCRINIFHVAIVQGSSSLGRGEKVFYGKKNFHRSSIEMRPFMVLLRVEEFPLPSLFLISAKFYMNVWWSDI